MAFRSLLPFGSRMVSARPAGNDPFEEFRRGMNRMFEEFARNAGMSGLALMPGRASEAVLTPRIDVSETDKQLKVVADLPGIDEKDIDVSLADDVLTIRGSKQLERDEEEQDFHIVERAQGTFYRSLSLPFSADPRQVDASFKDGVLTIAIPKPQEARTGEHRIQVTREAGSGQRQFDRAAAGDKPGSGEAATAAEPAAGEAKE